MRARVPEFAIQGEELRFVQHCHIVRRLLDIGRWLMRARTHGSSTIFSAC